MNKPGRSVTSSTRLLAIIGSHVGGSKSPLIHNAAFEHLGLDYVFLALEVRAEELEKAVEGFKAIKIAGLQPTMPHKNAVRKYIDREDRVASLAGSVNVVAREGDALAGYNSDGYGYVRSLEENGCPVKGKKSPCSAPGRKHGHVRPGRPGGAQSVQPARQIL